MSYINQYGLDRSLLFNLRSMFGEDMTVDLKYDGYEIPKTRPLILLEKEQNNFEIVSKGRETVEVIYRYQVGIFSNNSADLSRTQDRLQNLFLFNDFAYYDTSNNNKIVGRFDIILNNVTPVFADDIKDKSKYNRVYFDIEIETLKRRC